MSQDLIAAKNTFFRKNLLINCRGKLVDLSTPKVMGILNLTPDSFHDGGRYTGEGQILSHIEKMLNEKADMIDIGAVSSRPGAKDVSEDEEKSRLLPILESIVKKFPELVISIDTFRPGIADSCLGIGASIINDIYAGTFDEKIFGVAAKHNAPLIIMHMQNTPADMQESPQYEDVVLDVCDFLSSRYHKAIEMGVKDVIIDPGFGFGKTVEHNYNLLHSLDYISNLFGIPILAGISRKSMISKLLEIRTDDTLNGTSALNMLALIKGACILRVHDVKEAVEVRNLFIVSEHKPYDRI
ncbi:MAG: dihydropteroate synthase [Chitinophagales bacterium]|nr:dihydropteroate synthase [Chitinophagales bacterium]